MTDQIEQTETEEAGASRTFAVILNRATQRYLSHDPLEEVGFDEAMLVDEEDINVILMQAYNVHRERVEESQRYIGRRVPDPIELVPIVLSIPEPKIVADEDEEA